MIGQASRERLEEFVRGFAASTLGESLVIDSDIAFDPATATATSGARP